jgi:hypothetical protein
MGLVPVQLDGLRIDSLFRGDRQGLPGDALRPWDNAEFGRSQDPREADTIDVGALLGTCGATRCGRTLTTPRRPSGGLRSLRSGLAWPSRSTRR